MNCFRLSDTTTLFIEEGDLSKARAKERLTS